MNEPRIGLVGYHCRNGLGELSRQIAKYLRPVRWLVKRHKAWANSSETFPGVIQDLSGETPIGIQRFVGSVDIVLFCEVPYFPRLLDECRRQRRRTVCVPMFEWLPEPGREWTHQVDLYICPTEQAYTSFRKQLPCACFPWPVDVSRYTFRERETCHQFLFIEGHGGYKGRKGTAFVQQVLAAWPDMPLLVRTQRGKGQWPRVLTEVADNPDLYSEGDALLAPHSVDGIGLELSEAMACGMPVISPNQPPWNEIPSLAELPSTVRTERIKRIVPWTMPQVAESVTLLKSLVGTDIHWKSQAARAWTESCRWEKMADRFRQLVLGSVI